MGQTFYTNSHYEHFVVILQTALPCKGVAQKESSETTKNRDEELNIIMTVSDFPFVENLSDYRWMNDVPGTSLHLFDMRDDDLGNWLKRLSSRLGFGWTLVSLDAVLDMPVPPAFETDKINVLVLTGVTETLRNDPAAGLAQLAALISACRSAYDQGVRCKVVILEPD